ncbi:MAG: hypothetical protein J0L53_04680 [Spirochaetes bacterium]|nr:hypothetical protein [Spirochaetota bacterium]
MAQRGGGANPSGFTPAPAQTPPAPVNLVTDPGFEAGVSGFEPGAESASVARIAPALAGNHSLRVAITNYGDSIWWAREVYGKATAYTVSGRLRSDVASASNINFCAFIVYADGSNTSRCAALTGAAGDKGLVTASLVPEDKVITNVRIRIEQEGSQGVTLTLDDVSAVLTGFMPETQPGGGNPGGGNGGGPAPGGDPNDVTPPAGTPYPGYTYTPPVARPYIQMNNFNTSGNTSAAFLRLRDQVDGATAVTAALPVGATYEQLVTALNSQHYGYSCADSVVMYRLTNNIAYLQQAIRMVDLFVSSEMSLINSGQRPHISGDSYLEVGYYMEQLALTYDYGFALLSPSQRAQWESYANQTMQNLWYPGAATWGGVAYPWSGWSINDPGNNYFYSFLKATQLWAWASQNNTWITFLQQRKYPLLVPFFSVLSGGGTREGTGYGTAIGSMFENYRYWRASTGEDLSAISSHSRDTIDYWIHATVPTLDYYAAIGDQARSANPRMFDFQRRLMLEAVALNPATAQAARGVWWLNRARLSDGGSGSVVGRMRYNYNFRFDLLVPTTAEVQPTALVYDASGAGALFARSDWGMSASWIAAVVGDFDQSHAHEEQGTFSFYKGGWLTVTSNIHSRSGINQDVPVHNVVRFAASGAVIPQNYSTSTKTVNDAGNVLTVQENLTPAYSRRASEVQAWSRQLVYNRGAHTLAVHDVCTVAPGVTATWQLHTPVAPVVQPDGSYLAGNLRITPVLPAAPVVTVVSMNALDNQFNSGYRLEIAAGAGCEFRVNLAATN